MRQLIILLLLFTACSQTDSSFKVVLNNDNKSVPTYPIIDITSGTVSVDNDTITAIMTLKNIPDTIEYNSKEIRKGFVEYYWAVYFDINNDSNMFNDIWLEIMYNNFEQLIGEKTEAFPQFFKTCYIESYIWQDSINNKLIKGYKTVQNDNNLIFKIPVKSLGDSVDFNKNTPVLFTAFIRRPDSSDIHKNYQDFMTNQPDNFRKFIQKK